MKAKNVRFFDSNTLINLERYHLITDKISIPMTKKFISLPDAHIGKNSNNHYAFSKLKAVISYLEQQKNIEAVILPGDNAQSGSTYYKTEYSKQLKDFLREISVATSAPVILSLGNHDLHGKSEEVFNKFKYLESIPNVYALNNEQIEINGIVYTGFSPRQKAYSIFSHGQKANQMFLEDWSHANLKFDAGKLHVLSCHSPHFVSNLEALNSEEMKEMYSAVTLITAGHLHNGYIPDFLERKLQKEISDKGIWESPKSVFFIDQCRGAYLLGNGKKSCPYLPSQTGERTITFTGEEKTKAALVVSKGVAKYLWAIPSKPSVTEITVANQELEKVLIMKY